MLTKLLGGAKLWAAGINWPLLFYKLLAAGLMMMGFGIICYREGKHDCQVEVQQAKITVLETEIIKERKEVKSAIEKHADDIRNRLKVLTTNSQEIAKLDSRLAEIKGDLNDAIRTRPANDACAPSDAELRYYEELARQTH